VGRETFRTGGKILTDIAEIKSTELSPKDILSKHVTESVQNLIGNLRGGGRMKARGVSSGKRKDAKRARVKRDIFTRFTTVTRQHVGGHVDKKPDRYFYAQAHSNGRAVDLGDGVQTPRPRGAERFGIFDTW
jgi:hypothetical protein